MQINSTNQNINEPQPSPNTSSNSDQKLIEKKSSSIFSNNNPTDIFSNSIDVINQTANNYCLQKRNRINSLEIENISKLEIDDEILNKKYENLHKNFIPKKKLINNKKQIMYKKMSIDLDSDSNQNQNFINTNFTGCNCKNSGCLKRYCECFSRMKYCDENCQCKNCFNVVQHERERSNAIRNYIIKSPISFKKINIDLKNITCNCKKSNCLKNYCECYQLGLKCNNNCKCSDCKNRDTLNKKLFYVETNIGNNYEKMIKNINLENNLKNNNGINMIKLKGENEDNKNDNENKGKSINFIVNKNYTLNKNNIAKNNIKQRRKILSSDEEYYFQWNNLHLKKIEISSNQLIIDNYNINSNFIQLNEENYRKDTNFSQSNNSDKNANNQFVIIPRKNSAFSVMIL